MNAIKVATMIDDAVVRAIPALSPMFGRQVEIIVLDAAPPLEGGKLSADELIASRRELPAGSALSQDDIDRAIAEGARGG